MPIQYHKGNVFESEADVIFQGCNCFCTQRSGLAKEMIARYPEALKADCETKAGDRNKLGTFTLAYSEKDKRYLFNLYTQYKYGLNKCYLDYKALERALNYMADTIDWLEIGNHIASGRIGAGRAGGDWNKISSIIETIFPNTIIHIYDLE